MLHNGLYEQIINKGLDSELSVTDKLSQTAPIDSAEASKVLAKYVAEIVEKGLNNVKDNGGDLNSQVDLVNRIVSTITRYRGRAKIRPSVLSSTTSSLGIWTSTPRSAIRTTPPISARALPWSMFPVSRRRE